MAKLSDKYNNEEIPIIDNSGDLGYDDILAIVSDPEGTPEDKVVKLKALLDDKASLSGSFHESFEGDSPAFDYEFIIPENEPPNENPKSALVHISFTSRGITGGRYMTRLISVARQLQTTVNLDMIFSSGASQNPTATGDLTISITDSGFRIVKTAGTQPGDFVVNVLSPTGNPFSNIIEN